MADREREWFEAIVRHRRATGYGHIPLEDWQRRPHR